PAPPAAVEPPAPKEEEIFTAVEQNPEFPGGMSAFGKFLGKNIEYPAEATENNIAGKVILRFTVNKDGSIEDIKVLKGVGFGCDEEAVRVLKMTPRWTPGKQSGRAVRVSYSVPIVFSLPTD
ncbi:MAG: energy transducer TonB, partial [Pseudarcicella sp.]|nr:energy transducer TonB [Pseudarcicella sp.]